MKDIRSFAALSAVLLVAAPGRGQPAMSTRSATTNDASGRALADRAPVGPASRTPEPPGPTGPTGPTVDLSEPRPFGENLFQGSYAAQGDSGISPSYRILPGDRIMVNAWGAVTLNSVFVVDAQGNIFLPTVGPVALAGVPLSGLTSVVTAAIRRVYRSAVGVYTNMLLASPVGVFVTGAVVRPGRYAGVPNDSVLFFLNQAGGIDPDHGSYRRVRVRRGDQDIASVDLYDFLLRGTLSRPQLEDNDTIIVEQRGPTVVVARKDMPAVRAEMLPGSQHTGEDILRALPASPRVTSVTLEGMRADRSIGMNLSPSALAQTPVEDGDRLTFLEDLQPDYITVHLEGEFKGPATLTVRRGTRLLDFLNYVAVDPALSRTDAIHLKRSAIRQSQAIALKESLERLERATLLARSDTVSESQIRAQEARMVQQFVASAREIEPLGLMVTTTGGRELNVLLRADDVVVIPPATNVVQVAGEVQIPHAVMYRPDLKVDDYVAMAGGYGPNADRGRPLIRRANAEILVGKPDMRLSPGDLLMVTPSVDDKFAQNAMDLAQVIYQIAVAASVVLNPLIR